MLNLSEVKVSLRRHVCFVKVPIIPLTVIADEFLTYLYTTDMRRLTTGIRSEKCLVGWFRCANVIECTYTNLDSTV